MTSPRAFRVALVAPEFPPEIGGMQTYADELFRGLCERGVAVTVFTKRGSQPSPDPRVEPVLAASWSDDRQLVRDRAPDFDLWHVLNAAYSWVALAASPVVLSAHGNDLLQPNAIAPLALGDRYGLPWSSRLDLLLSRWRTKRLMQRAIPRLGHAISNSEFTRNLLLERFRVPSDRTSVGYVGVATRFLESSRPERPRDGPAQLLTVARLSEPRKNVDQVLRALAPLQADHQFIYRIAGEGHLRPSLERLAEELGLADRVRFLGRVPDEALVELYGSSDLFLLPASCSEASVEGFGIVYLEANACGTPVLAANQGGAREAIEPGVSGILVAQPTVDEIQQALTRFLRHELVFSAAECSSFAACFGWNRVVDHTLECYSRLA